MNSKKSDAPQPNKIGWLRKRGGRMHRWSLRYFTLNGPHIAYKLKPEGPIRGEFDLAPGCAVTEIDESRGGIGNNKMYSFWIVWPYDKTDKPKIEINNAKVENTENEGEKQKDLKQILQKEKVDYKEEHKKTEEQIELHQQQDNSLSLGVKVAAVAVGGVVVGALTAGIGLVPYITVVGLTAVAGGGAVALQYRKPSDSRLILACETMAEALSWKQAFEEQVFKLEKQVKPMLPLSVDPVIISGIIGMGKSSCNWRKVGLQEGMRILELQVGQIKNTRTRRSQIFLQHAPFNIFLALMEIPSPYWPRNGDIKIIKIIDDHADIISVNVLFGKKGIYNLKLSRFWKLEDDGTYLITYNTVAKGEFEPENAMKSDNITKHDPKTQLQMNAVITIAPRKDHTDFDEDLREALVTASIQVSLEKENVYTKDIEEFMNDYLMQLVELKFGMQLDKFSYEKFRSSSPSYKSAQAASITTSPSRTNNLRPLKPPLQIMETSKTSRIGSLFRIRASGTAEDSNKTSAGPSTISNSAANNSHEILNPSPKSDQLNHIWENQPKPLSKNLKSVQINDSSFSSPAAKIRSSRRRSNTVNTEASVLRSQIAAKEYELQRITKLVKRRSGQIQVMSKSGDESELKQEAQSLDDLKVELQLLKDKYTKLTGMSYGEPLIDRKRRVRNLAPVGYNNSDLSNGKEKRLSNSSQDIKDEDVLSRVRSFSILPSPSFDLSQKNEAKNNIYPSHWYNQGSKKNSCDTKDTLITFIIVLFFGFSFFLSTYIKENLYRLF